MTIERATSNDLACILRWLKAEFHREELSFWSSRDSISEAFEEGELWVIREGDDTVAFQVGTYSPLLVIVRGDKQRLGYGKMLVEAASLRASRDGIFALSVECPQGSPIEFWEKLGFKRCGEARMWGQVILRRGIERAIELPDDLPRLDVTIEFYPEAALRCPDVRPIAVHRLTGGLIDLSDVMLERRVVTFADAVPEGRDVAIRISINGVEICFCKAKHEKAQDHGVQRDASGSAFYIDDIFMSFDQMSAVRETLGLAATPSVFCPIFAADAHA